MITYAQFCPVDKTAEVFGDPALPDEPKLKRFRFSAWPSGHQFLSGSLAGCRLNIPATRYLQRPRRDIWCRSFPLSFRLPTDQAVHLNGNLKVSLAL